MLAIAVTVELADERLVMARRFWVFAAAGDARVPQYPPAYKVDVAEL